MAMSDQGPLPWEVWHARFDFSEGSGYKFRPVVVLAANSRGTIAAMVTSATNKLALEYDYRLKDWRMAGLDKPSIVRLRRVHAIGLSLDDPKGLIRDWESNRAAIREIIQG